MTRSLGLGVSDWILDFTQTIVHSDRATQYTSQALSDQLAALRMERLMSVQGPSYGSASCESFFSTLRRELMPDYRIFESRREALLRSFEQIEGIWGASATR